MTVIVTITAYLFIYNYLKTAKFFTLQEREYLFSHGSGIPSAQRSRDLPPGTLTLCIYIMAGCSSNILNVTHPSPSRGQCPCRQRNS